MKKYAVIGGVIAVLVIGGLAWWLVAKPNDSANTNTATGGSGNGTEYAAKDACNVLTQNIADQILGAGAEIGVGNNNTASDDVNVSTCTYSAKTDGTIAGVKNMKLATLMVRSPLSADGVRSNEQPFNPIKEGAQAVAGYGEKAFWDPEFGQLNVLKNGSWLILSYGKAGAADRTPDEAKRFADAIIPTFK
jgi:hypothetical protein